MLPPKQSAALQNYLSQHYASIEGWCWEYNWQPIQYLAARHREMNTEGPVAEIGVFHGKFFIGLCLLGDGLTPHVAIDVFDMQKFSLSGDGSRIRVPKNSSDAQLETFKSNLQKCGVTLDRVKIIRSDSTNLTPREIERLVPGIGKFSMFSVDGCHEFTHAYNDISLAMELTDNYGIIFVDDYLHARWPGAQEAVAKLMFGGAPKFVPLYYIHNKLALCHVNFHSDYLEGLMEFYRTYHPSSSVRRVTRYGWQSLTIEPKVGAPILVSQ